MNNFVLNNPVKVVFGPGELSKVGQEASALGATKAMVVSYLQHEILSDALKRVEASLSEAGVTVVPFYGVSANPTLDECAEGVEKAKDAGVDLVIAVGGGSAMDSAKIIAAGMFYEHDLWMMIRDRHDASENTIEPTQALPIMCIPTLPATSSEMNPGAVVTNPDTQEKSYVFASVLFPKVAILDPELTTTLPAYQTAAGVADAISHAMESYLFSPGDTPLQDGFLESVFRTLIDNVRIVLKTPDDVTARANIQWAACMAWNGILDAGINAWAPMHQFGHVISARFNVAHGATLSMIMPSYMRYILPKRLDRLTQLATRVFDVDPMGWTDMQLASEGIDAFEAFLMEIGMPTRLSHANVPADAIDVMCDDVCRISLNADGVLNGIPTIDPDGIREIYELAKD
jgi:alcohol dehydrogenase YqhD (iron-dependent ADH family)